jgi:hypothetical protein
MRTLRNSWLWIAVCVLAASSVGLAEDAKKDASATGTWKWTFTRQDGTTGESSVKLKQEAEKVTGTYIGRDGKESAIEDGKVKDATLAFTVTREFNGNKFVIKYEGKITGDTIKGKMEFERDGQAQSRDWDAKRQAASVAGNWKWTRTRDDGTTIDAILKLKQDGEKITGVSIYNNAENAIENGKIKGTEVGFQVTRERDGNKTVVKFAGMLETDVLKGKITATTNGEDREFEMEYKRVKE